MAKESGRSGSSFSTTTRTSAGLVPSLYQQDISQLGRVGATDQAQAQAEADATREGKRMEAYEPYERLGYLGTGVTGLLGGYPGQYQSHCDA